MHRTIDCATDATDANDRLISKQWTDDTEDMLTVYDWADDEVSTMLLAKAIHNGDEVDAEDLVRAKERASTARGRMARAAIDADGDTDTDVTTTYTYDDAGIRLRQVVELQRTAVSDRLATVYPNRPIKSPGPAEDGGHGPADYELRPDQIQDCMRNIVQGSGRIWTR